MSDVTQILSDLAKKLFVTVLRRISLKRNLQIQTPIIRTGLMALAVCLWDGKTVRGCLMLDPGPGTTSKALYLEKRITVTTQDSKPGIQRLVVWRIHHQRNRML